MAIHLFYIQKNILFTCQNYAKSFSRQQRTFFILTIILTTVFIFFVLIVCIRNIKILIFFFIFLQLVSCTRIKPVDNNFFYLNWNLNFSFFLLFNHFYSECFRSNNQILKSQVYTFRQQEIIFRN